MEGHGAGIGGGIDRGSSTGLILSKSRFETPPNPFIHSLARTRNQDSLGIISKLPIVDFVARAKASVA